MSLRSPRFIVCALLAVILAAGLAVYGWLWGIPQWSVAFQGELLPLITAYGGWTAAIGIVAVGTILVGICVAVSWIQGTYHYLMLALGAAAVLTFVTLGLPAQSIAQIQDAISFVIVGLCGLLMLGVFLSALKERLTRRFRA